VEVKSTIKILSASSVGSWHVRLNRDSGLLAGDLASTWHCLLLGGGLSITGLCLLSPMMSMMLLEREASF
jgi:hypothetical protein